MTPSSTSCQLCHKVYNPRLGKLIEFWSNRAHINCVRFVKEERNKAQYQELVAKAQETRCDLCAQTRASAKCSVDLCSKTFHVGCVVSGGGEVDYLRGQIVCSSHVQTNDSKSLGECILCGWKTTVMDGVSVPCCSGVLHLTCAQIRCSSKKLDCPSCENTQEYADNVRRRGVYISGTKDEIDFVSELQGSGRSNTPSETSPFIRLLSSSSQSHRIKPVSPAGRGRKLSLGQRTVASRSDAAKSARRSLPSNRSRAPILIDLTDDAGDEVKVVGSVTRKTAPPATNWKKRQKKAYDEDSDYHPGADVQPDRSTSLRHQSRTNGRGKRKLLVEDFSDNSSCLDDPSVAESDKDDISTTVPESNVPTSSTKVSSQNGRNNTGAKQKRSGGKETKIASKMECSSTKGEKAAPAKRRKRQRVERWILNGEKPGTAPRGRGLHRIQAESETESCSSETCSETGISSPQQKQEPVTTSNIRSGSESGYVTKSGSVSPLEPPSFEDHSLPMKSLVELSTKKSSGSDEVSALRNKVSSLSASARKRRRASDQENIAPKKRKAAYEPSLGAEEQDIQPWLAKNTILRVDSVADIDNSDMILRHCFGEALDHLIKPEPMLSEGRSPTACPTVSSTSDESQERDRSRHNPAEDKDVRCQPQAGRVKRTKRKLIDVSLDKNMHPDLMKVLGNDRSDQSLDDQMELPLEYHPSPDQSFCIDETENTFIQERESLETETSLEKRNLTASQVRKKKTVRQLRELNSRPIINGRNWTPWRQEEQEFEPVSFDGVPETLVRNISDFVDLNRGEKELLCLWNNFLAHKTFYGCVHLPLVLERFVDVHGARIIHGNMYRNFIIHLNNLEQGGCIDSPTLLQVIARIQAQVSAEDCGGSSIPTSLEAEVESEDELQSIMKDLQKDTAEIAEKKTVDVEGGSTGRKETYQSNSHAADNCKKLEEIDEGPEERKVKNIPSADDSMESLQLCLSDEEI